MTEHDEEVIPEARCAVHGFVHRALGFRYCIYTRHWLCECQDCKLADEGEHPIGSGKTKWQALEHYASEHYGLNPEELVIRERHV